MGLSSRNPKRLLREAYEKRGTQPAPPPTLRETWHDIRGTNARRLLSEDVEGDPAGYSHKQWKSYNYHGTDGMAMGTVNWHKDRIQYHTDASRWASSNGHSDLAARHSRLAAEANRSLSARESRVRGGGFKS